MTAFLGEGRTENENVGEWIWRERKKRKKKKEKKEKWKGKRRDETKEKDEERKKDAQIYKREKRVFSSVTLSNTSSLLCRRRARRRQTPYLPAFGNQPDIHKHGGRGKKNGKENGKWMRSVFATDIMLSKGAAPIVPVHELLHLRINNIF